MRFARVSHETIFPGVSSVAKRLQHRLQNRHQHPTRSLMRLAIDGEQSTHEKHMNARLLRQSLASVAGRPLGACRDHDAGAGQSRHPRRSLAIHPLRRW